MRKAASMSWKAFRSIRLIYSVPFSLITHNLGCKVISYNCADSVLDTEIWCWCLTYCRDVVSHCYLRLPKLCRSPWLTSRSVRWNVYSVAYLTLSGHFKGGFVCFGPYVISSYSLPLKWKPQYLQLYQEMFGNEYTKWTLIFRRKVDCNVKFQW